MADIEKEKKLDLDGLNVEVILLEVEMIIQEEMPYLDPSEKADSMQECS